MLNELTPRQQRGLTLATTVNIRRKSGMFEVPSQTNSGASYIVAKVTDEFHCTCPDYELTGRTCKHGFAVQYLLKLERTDDGTVTETRAVKVTYGQNWPAYNRSQVVEKEAFCALLRDLVADVPSPEQKRGRPALPLADMLFAACYKVYSTVSGRRFMTDLRDATAKGFIGKTPHYNSIFNVLDNEAITPILKKLITKSALPLKALETEFAVDSTGFGTQNFYRHYTAKYGRDQMRREFVKVHAMVGVKTNVITSAEVSSSGDSPMLPELVANTAANFDVQAVAADKAYSSYMNLEMLDAIGVKALIPFRANAVEQREGQPRNEVWARLFHFFHLHREEFLAAYHVRSNVESTFSAIKRKFSDQIRSKTPVAQTNEALLKVLCHNLVCLIHQMNESGAVAAFPALMACTKIHTTAQVIEVKA